MNKESKNFTDVIRIGYSLSLSGPVAENTKAARLVHRIWEEDINSRGGLLGRKVELICVDDHGDASQVAGIYRQLLDKQKVELVIGGYGKRRVGRTTCHTGAVPKH